MGVKRVSSDLDIREDAVVEVGAALAVHEDAKEGLDDGDGVADAHVVEVLLREDLNSGRGRGVSPLSRGGELGIQFSGKPQCRDVCDVEGRGARHTV